jgi:hypothetical protein
MHFPDTSSLLTHNYIAINVKSINYLLIVFFAVMETKLRILHMLGNYSTTLALYPIVFNDLT